jgi:hypothetical protein
MAVHRRCQPPACQPPLKCQPAGEPRERFASDSAIDYTVPQVSRGFVCVTQARDKLDDGSSRFLFALSDKGVLPLIYTGAAVHISKYRNPASIIHAEAGLCSLCNGG